MIEDGRIVVMPRPYIEVIVADGHYRSYVNFLIDTGCDKTTLHPGDAYGLWSSEFLHWDFESEPSSSTSTGVGGVAASVTRSVRLSFIADDDRVQSVSLSCQVDVAKPDDRSDPRFSNWSLPSLLGRDVLAHFRLEMAYVPTPQVTLSMDDVQLP